jgi:quercetin dioxygenase-like cupin family protein
MSRPYNEQRLSDDRMLREFSGDVSPDELEWHMDRRSRSVTVLAGDGWKLQLESGLPFSMVKGETYVIPRESWHRVIKGSGNLRILIRED